MNEGMRDNFLLSKMEESHWKNFFLQKEKLTRRNKQLAYAFGKKGGAGIQPHPFYNAHAAI